MVREVDFSYDDAMRTMGLTPGKLDKLIEEGKLPVVHDGIHVLIPRSAILAYLSEVSAVPIRERKGKASA